MSSHASTSGRAQLRSVCGCSTGWWPGEGGARVPHLHRRVAGVTCLAGRPWDHPGVDGEPGLLEAGLACAGGRAELAISAGQCPEASPCTAEASFVSDQMVRRLCKCAQQCVTRRSKPVQQPVVDIRWSQPVPHLVGRATLQTDLHGTQRTHKRSEGDRTQTMPTREGLCLKRIRRFPTLTNFGLNRPPEAVGKSLH
jgi:hypothetical protein